MERWAIGDPHLQHKAVITFEDVDGRIVRPYKNVSEHDEAFIANWNSVVGKRDKVDVLGDVLFGNKNTGKVLLDRLNGKKSLIIGNHDPVVRYRLWEHFKEIELWKRFKEHDFVFSHVPLPKSQFRKVNFNVHAHTHHRIWPGDDYVCISAEQINMTPINFDDILKTLQWRRDHGDVRLQDFSEPESRDAKIVRLNSSQG